MSENPNCIVTVITTTFNLIKNDRVDFFKQCVESVHSQDYQHIEHLVIDGASSDGSLEIIREYEQKGWLTCISEPDKGIYDAMNKGIRLAKGKYIAFLNSDDFWHDSHGVSESVKALEATQAAFSYADRNIISLEGKLIWHERANVALFLHQMPFCHQTIFTRRDTLLKHNGFNHAEYNSAADYDLIVRIIMSGESCVYVPFNFTSFRCGGFSTTDTTQSDLECDKIKEAHMKGASIEELHNGRISDDFLQHLLCKVHPSIGMNLLRSYTLIKPDVYRLTAGQVLFNEKGERFSTYSSREVAPAHSLPPAGSAETPLCSTVRHRLFGFIPLIKIKNKHHKTSFYLFGFLLLWTQTTK